MRLGLAAELAAQRAGGTHWVYHCYDDDAVIVWYSKACIDGGWHTAAVGSAAREKGVTRVLMRMCASLLVVPRRKPISTRDKAKNVFNTHLL